VNQHILYPKKAMALRTPDKSIIGMILCRLRNMYGISIQFTYCIQECRPPINHKIQDKIHKIFAPLKFVLSKKWSAQDASLPAMFSTVQTL